MDFDSAIALSAKLAAWALFVYGLIVFSDQAAGELIKGGVAYFVSPYIWGSGVPWPLAGSMALLGLLGALIGFFVLRFKSREEDFTSEASYVWPLLRAFIDTSILFFAICLTWEVLLSIHKPGMMYIQVIQTLNGTGMTNMLVMDSSAIMLVLLAAFKMRHVLFGWLPPWLTSKRFTLGFGFLSLSLGAAILVIALHLASSFNVVNILAQPRYLSCNEECYFAGTLDLVAGCVGAVLAIVGLIASTERLIQREPTA